jgi:hypothetical protein
VKKGKFMTTRKSLIITVVLTVFAAMNLLAATATIDGAKIDQITGLKGKLNAKEGVYKVTFPRNDVPVTVDGWKMPPFMGLTTWAEQPEPTRSDSHAWSAHPNFDFLTIVAGIRPKSWYIAE